MFNNKTFLIIATAMLLVATSFTQPTRAHDTDIYVGSAASSPEPVIIFTLDYQSNLNAVICDPGSCDPAIEALIANKYLILQTGATKVLRFDLMRAVIKKVLDDRGGFKVGLALNHDDNNGCAGPAAVQCSGGAMIHSAAVSFKKGTDSPTSYTPSDPLEDPGKQAFFELLDDMPIPKGTINHSWQGEETYFELFRYLTGQEVYNGHNGWEDFGTKTDGFNLDNALDIMQDAYGIDRPTPEWDATAEGKYTSDTYYVSPLQTTNATDCAGVYVVNITFGGIAAKNDALTDIMAAKIAGGMATDSGPVAADSNKDGFTNMLKWLNDIDLADGTFGPGAWDGRADSLNGVQNVTSYFLIFENNIANPNFTNTQVSWAEAGGTTRPIPISDDPTALEDALDDLLNNILSVSTTFVAPSIAVNVYNRAQVESDLFIAMFEANKDNKVAWSGNVKKFNLDLEKSIIVHAKATPQSAVNPDDGRIADAALSFWTMANELEDPDPDKPEEKFKAGADGRFIERGGCGSRVPGYKLTCSGIDCVSNESPGRTNHGLGSKTSATSNRNVFTDPETFTNGASTPLRALEATTNATTGAGAADIKAALGVADTGDCLDTNNSVDACNLIKYIRGLNYDDSNRSWMFADPLHSRPLAVNYGGGDPDATPPVPPEIRIFVGTNDGLLHMIRNTDNSGADESGIEGWAYMPLDVMGNVSDFYVGATGNHAYGIDGPPTAVTRDVDGDGNIESGDGDYVHLFFGLRRGGRGLYALNVTNPDVPELLWHIKGGIDGDDFEELGETWSQPVITQVLHNGNNTSTPVLIFGGGYDPNKDDNTINHAAAAGGPDSTGRAVFIVDASNGNLIWKTAFPADDIDPANLDAAKTNPASAAKTHWVPEMVHSIPSKVTAVDSDGNGLTDRIYVGDTGGNIWRIDTKSNDEFETGNEWNTSLLFKASVNGTISSDGLTITLDGTTTDRRFFYEPDYVQAKDSDGVAYDAIVIGTGDRAHPTNLTSDNYFYVIRDRETSSGIPTITTLTHAALGDVTDNCLQDATPCSPGPYLSNGWRLKLHCPWQAVGGECGEKALSSAFTVASEIFFTTYQPANSSTTSDCKPSEGEGFLYTLKLEDATATQDYDSLTAGLTTSDRYEPLKSGGIPSGVVNVGGGKIVRPDLTVQETNLKGGYRSFWLENDNY